MLTSRSTVFWVIALCTCVSLPVLARAYQTRHWPSTTLGGLDVTSLDLPVPSVRPTPVASPTPVPVSLTVVYRLIRVSGADGAFCELHRVTSGTYTRDDLVARRLSTTTPFAITTTANSVALTLTASDASTVTLYGTRRAS